ncbi:UvrD-helicase domain-containing protein [Flavobacteriaceae bacterium]|nr:UvrD-helicase domain-containing protein [Flavobacteriaceae bacterium]
MMHNLTPIEIISASAGSGKTYKLVLSFLRTLLSSSNPNVYRKMIALTFTNKAVFEMKSRILNKLNEFSDLDNQDQMAAELCEFLEVSNKELAFRSKQALKFILHDYAAFEIVTLDRFTHRIIRSFSRDLGLSHSFEVEINQKLILSEVVNRVIEKVGSDEYLTKLLERFTLQKIRDQKSWEITPNLLEISYLLLKENDRIPTQELAKQPCSSFEEQNKVLKKVQKDTKQNIHLIGKEVLKLFELNGLEGKDFSRRILYAHFEKLKDILIAKVDVNKLYSNQLENNLEEGVKIYNKTLDDRKAKIIEGILPIIYRAFKKAKNLNYQLSLINDILDQWIPLSLIQTLSKELEVYQKEQNKVLLATFNERISKEILNQSTPHIYERLGEHYRHYFLDEFQDTSSLQWDNLIPLVREPIEGLGDDGRPGSLLIVGDPKQSIYRWRGGHVEQFLSLLRGKNPFQVPVKIESLETNYRSFETIVNFNNAFFKSTIPFLKGEENKKLFSENCSQKLNNKKQGYVEINQFYEVEKEVILNNNIETTFKSIKSSLEQGFNYHDIAVLVRKKDQAKSIGEYLIEKGIPIISSESLNLSNSEEVQFIIALLRLAIDENNDHERLFALQFLRLRYAKEVPYHDFIAPKLKTPLQVVFNEFEIPFNFMKFKSLSLYEAVEEIFYGFDLSSNFDAHLQTFLDHAFEFNLNKKNDLLSFILHWDSEGDSLFVNVPKGLDAIQIFTIHKAKGLEFPVVILPFLDELSRGNKEDRIWMNTEEFFDQKLTKGWIPFSKKIANYGAVGKQRFEEISNEKELDDHNVLYVAMTRPVEQLILISNLKKRTPKTDELKNTYPSLIQNYLQIKNVANDLDTDSVFYFEGKKRTVVESKNIKKETNDFYIESKTKRWKDSLMTQSYAPEEVKQNSPKLWGILIHDLLSKIESSEDIDWVLKEASIQGKIKNEKIDSIREIILNVINHTELASYFTNEYTVWNERDILIPNKDNVRPDRLMYNGENLVLIDYKTGKAKKQDVDQIKYYENIISEIFYDKPINSYLVYIQEKTNINVVVV